MNCTPQFLAQQSACWISCISAGNAGAVRNFILCQIAKVGLKPQGFLPQLTNFSFFPGAGTLGLANAVATWDVPPAGATGTEFWTSPDNTTYTLFTTVTAPAATTQRSPPAVGSFMWAKARWVNSIFQGAFCAPQEVSGRVCDWAARLVTNGGTSTSVATRKAVNTFDLALVSAAIDSLMVYVLLFVPDNLIAAITPLYKVAGNDPATNNGPFVAGDLTVNGLMGDGVAKFLQIGITPNVTWPINGAVDNGLTAYRVTAGNGAGLEIGAANANNNNWIQVDNAGGNTTFATYGITLLTDWLVQGNSLFTGFVSGQRGSLARADIYVANSTTAFGSIANTTNGIGQHGTNCNVPLLVFALNSGGAAANFLGQRLSYVSAENALSTAQCQSYFNAIQAFRTALGGGFV